jgi:cyclopropane fatty-acyl-phospholipid synthase-like methyltransferase
MAQVGLHTLGVDFSPIAIAKARARVAHDALKPSFQVGDVTALSLAETFDISFDVGCFHCLGDAQQLAYVAQLSQLLLAGGTHLIWALDRAPSGQRLSGEAIERVFAPAFTLASAEKNRRRLVASHWYWLRRQ